MSPFTLSSISGGRLLWCACHRPSIWRLFKGASCARCTRAAQPVWPRRPHRPQRACFSHLLKLGKTSMDRRGKQPRWRKCPSVSTSSTRALSKTPSIVSEPTRDGHRLIRRILSPAFSDKNMRELEPTVQEYISLFI